jgi:hypothetical protein
MKVIKRKRITSGKDKTVEGTVEKDYLDLILILFRLDKNDLPATLNISLRITVVVVVKRIALVLLISDGWW